MILVILMLRYSFLSHVKLCNSFDSTPKVIMCSTKKHIVEHSMFTSATYANLTIINFINLVQNFVEDLVMAVFQEYYLPSGFILLIHLVYKSKSVQCRQGNADAFECTANRRFVFFILMVSQSAFFDQIHPTAFLCASTYYMLDKPQTNNPNSFFFSVFFFLFPLEVSA